MSTHTICFYGEITKMIPKFSNTLLTCSTNAFAVLCDVFDFQVRNWLEIWRGKAQNNPTEANLAELPLQHSNNLIA